MWAMIPMLRTRSSATADSVVLVLKSSFPCLPAVVREGLVGLRHPVDVVLALERAALLIERVQNLVGQLVAHALLPPLARERHEPAHGERAGPALRHLDRNLVVRAADAATADLEDRGHGLHRLLEHLDRRPAGLRADLLERVVDDLLGDRLLAVEHDLVDHLRDERRGMDGVGLDGPGLDFASAGHQFEPLLAPYFERACLRSATPPVSSAARMILYRKPGRSLTRPPRTSTTECSWSLCPSPGM